MFDLLLKKFLNDPVGFIKKAHRLGYKSILKKLLVISFDYYKYWFGKGESFYPKKISFNLTYRCNLRCKMCTQWGEAGNLKTLPEEQINEVLSFENLKSVIDGISFFEPYIYLWGGEPFLYPDLMEFIRYIIDEKGLKCGISTNGTYLNQFASELMGFHNEFDIFVSLDGSGAIHDSTRGRKGTFNKVITGVRAIQDFKRSKSQGHPHIYVVTTITKESFKFLSDIVDIATFLEAELLYISLSLFTTSEMGMKYSRLMEELFGCQANSWKGFLIDIDGIDIKYLKKTIGELQKRKNNPKIEFAPKLIFENMDNYYSNPYFSAGKKRCIFPWFSADIRPNGDVTFCMDYPDYILGNIKKESFLTIWNNRKACDFRKKLRKQKIFPICTRCCGLYAY